MWTITWVIKTTKLCNLRCRYCYEWNELDQPARISLDQWRRLLIAIRRYHELQCERFKEPVRSTLVWHGGEPLLLPLDYFEDVLELQGEILGGPPRADHEYQNWIQTNLYSPSDGHIELLTREQFGVGVSLDIVPGVRLDMAGGETETRVVDNLTRLLERGVACSAIVVLGGHTRLRLREVYDFFVEKRVPIRLVPLFEAPLNTPTASFAISDAEIAESMCDLFVYWFDNGLAGEVQPLATYLQTVLLHCTTLERLRLDRSRHGEYQLVVNTDGSLYEVVDRYAPGRALGNVFDQSLDEILNSPAYKASLERDDQLVRRHCIDCRYLGACDTHPIFALPHRYPPGVCPLAHHVCGFIETRLQEEGFTEEHLRDLAASIGRDDARDPR